MNLSYYTVDDLRLGHDPKGVVGWRMSHVLSLDDALTHYASLSATGVKSLGMDQGDPVFLGVPEGSEISMSEEHGAVYCEHNFKINDKLRYIPGHCCTTVNMFNEIYLVDGDEVIAKWDITSRGKAQ